MLVPPSTYSPFTVITEIGGECMIKNIIQKGVFGFEFIQSNIDNSINYFRNNFFNKQHKKIASNQDLTELN